MAGGIKQLTLKGALDYNFIGNPQISFFKVVYRRYTNFALESLDISLSRKTILDNDDITSIPSIIIPRNADLLSNVYLTFTLPNIYSGCYNADGDETSKINNIPYEFKWVENIGTNLIESAKLYIGTTEVNNIPGKLMQVLSEINYDDSKKKIYDDMIGNIPEIYNPKLNRSDKHKKFIAILEKEIGMEAIKENLPLQDGDVVATFADIKDLKNDFDYQPSTDISSGLKQFVSWYKEFYKL